MCYLLLDTERGREKEGTNRLTAGGTRNSICNKEHNYVLEFLIRSNGYNAGVVVERYSRDNIELTWWCVVVI